ncbi:hypothetical protein [Arenimonas composti]|uniref:STAS/SEC14 domain-containing protein n=1 Tax=Arenimonas composti TR7-09 = DSM 18010 TaxID=1121013 RepID=A0A091BST7_9GAMM|nr:hypothetical protein [Arenimonas composti]KFN47385.1 hypothetical protein P873_01710 [Arenimonas composti TR7-09 = DSM 18010]
MNPLPDDIQFQVEDRGDYLYVAVSGPRDSNEITVAYWQRIIEECQRRGTRRLMVYENLGDHEGERDLQALVEWLIEEGLGELQVAFVVARIELLAHMEFGEILAMERGAHGRVFADRALAERWLRHGSA